MLSFLHFLLEVISFLWLILTLGCFKSTRCTWFTQGSRLRYYWVNGWLNWPPSGRRWVCRVVELTWIRCGTDVDWGNCMLSSGFERGPCCRTSRRNPRPAARYIFTNYNIDVRYGKASLGKLETGVDLQSAPPTLTSHRMFAWLYRKATKNFFYL